MKNKILSLLLLVGFTLLYVGCANKNKASENSNNYPMRNSEDIKYSESLSNDSSSESNTTKKNGNSENYVLGKELDVSINTNKNALVIVGTKNSEKFGLLLETVKSIAKDRNISYYLIDIKDSQNKEWLNENDTFGQMNDEVNVGIISNKRICLFGLQDESEYKKELLGMMVDGIMGKLGELN